MTEENIIDKFRLKTMEKIKNYFIEETIRNDLMSKKHKKITRLYFLLTLCFFELLQ